MIRICAWCKRENPQGSLEQTEGVSSELISHGICPHHALVLLQGYRVHALHQRPARPQALSSQL